MSEQNDEQETRSPGIPDASADESRPDTHADGKENDEAEVPDDTPSQGTKRKKKDKTESGYTSKKPNSEDVLLGRGKPVS